jgi:hypothetical protein
MEAAGGEAMTRIRSLALVSVLVTLGLAAEPGESCDAHLPQVPAVETQVLVKLDALTVEVDAGRARGLLPGMMLVSLETTESLPLCDLEVVSVEDGTAVARGDEHCEALQPGHRVATRGSKYELPALEDR